MAILTRDRLSTTVSAHKSAPLLFEWRGIVKYLPLVLAGGFFILTVLWLAIGPLEWPITNPVLLYGFLIASIVMLVGGYIFGIERRQRTVDRGVVLDPNKLVLISGVVGVLLFAPTSYVTTGSWFPDVIGGLTDAGTAYSNTKLLNETSLPYVHYVRFLFAPILIIATPVTYFLWPRLSLLARVLGVASILGTAALAIAQGINKGMADLTAYVCLFLVLVAASSLRKEQRRRLISALVAIVVAIGLFLSSYALNIQSRVSSDIERETSSSAQGTLPNKEKTEHGSHGSSGKPATGDKKNENATSTVSQAEIAEAIDATAGMGLGIPRVGHPVDLLPGGLRSATMMLSGYVTQGYFGLSLALNSQWTPTWGLGSSEFVRHNAAKVLGGDAVEQAIEADSYAGKVTAQGWPVGAVWSTFFIHPASDISFPGVILLMGFIGYLFATAWRATVTRGDPLAAVLFYYLTTLVFYLPANNQLFQGGETAVGIVAIVIVWMLLRRGWGAGVFRRLGLTIEQA